MVSSRHLLARCVRDHDWVLPPPGLAVLDDHTAARLAEAATAHRVAGCVYRSLSAVGGVDEAIMADLGDEYCRTLVNHMRAIDDLAAADEILGAAGIPWMAIKGPVLAETYYPDPALRSYLDVDLLVRPEDLRRAVQVLERAGCRLVERRWADSARTLSAEVHLLLPYGTPLDLHWHLLNVPSLRRSVHLPMREIFGRARTLQVGRTPAVRTLDPVDTLVHLALHAVVSGGNRLVWMKDLEQAVLAGVDWDLLVERSKEADAALAVGTMLTRARATLGAPVPSQVLRGLSGSRAWSRLVGAAELLSPFAKPTPRAPGSQIVRSTRGHLAASAGHLACRVGGGMGRIPRRKVGAALQAGGFGRRVTVPAERRARLAYFATVERVGWSA